MIDDHAGTRSSGADAMWRSCDPVQTIGIVGAGMMGRSIALAAAVRGIQVRISDTIPSVLSAAISDCCRALGRTPLQDGRVRPVVSERDWGACDLVIEAVLEKLAVKRRVLAGIEPRLNAGCVIASNTSSLRIGEIATALQFPERCCGLHFLHPVSERAVVEVVEASCSSGRTLERAIGCVTQMGKTVIRVRDSSGFVVNRLLMSYLMESLEMLTEGVAISTVEDVAQRLGMPVGPLAQIDQIGVDVVVRVGAAFQNSVHQRPAAARLLMDLYAQRRWGCKTDAGFYRYRVNTEPSLDLDILRLIAQHVKQARPPSRLEIRQRLRLALVLEASRVLQDGVVARTEDIDLATPGGLGFTGEIACVFAWARRVGLQSVLGWCDRFREEHPHLAPTDRLRDLLEDSSDGLARAA